MEKKIVDAYKLDVLKELANIGMGHAVTALAQMLGEEKISMDVPVATLAPLQDVPELLGGAELPVAGVFIASDGDIQLKILFVLPLDSALNLTSLLLPAGQEDSEDLKLSTLLEVGNILTSSYLTALSLMTGLKLLPSPPAIALDMSAAIISTVMAEARIQDDEPILMQTTLSSQEKRITGQILMLPDRGALRKIFHFWGSGKDMRISRVKIADWAVLKDRGILMTVGLGSCVGVALYDVQQKIGGLVHILLPSSEEFPQRPATFKSAKFADTAIPLLVQEIAKVGGKKSRLQAKIAGGSQLFMNRKMGNSVGEKNVLMTRQVLGELGIPIAGEDVGGNYGRTLRFFVESGRVVISTVGRGEKEV